MTETAGDELGEEEPLVLALGDGPVDEGERDLELAPAGQAAAA